MEEVWKLQFFGRFASQRRTFLSTKDFSPIPLHPTVKSLLDAAGELPRMDGSLKRESIWRSSIRAISPLLVQSIVWNFLLSLGLMLSVFATKEVLDSAGDLNRAVLLCAVIFGVETFKNIIQYFDLIRRAQLARGIQIHLLTLVNRKLVRLDPSTLGEFSSGNLKTLIASDVEAIEDFISASTWTWIPTIGLLVILTPVVYYTIGWLGLLGIVIGLLQIPIAVCFAKIIERYQEKSQREQDKLTTLVGEWVRNIRLVRYLGWQKAFESDIGDAVRKYTIESGIRHFLVLISFGVSFSWWMLPIIGMVVASEVSGTKLEFATFFASIWALHHLMNYLQHIPWGISLYASASAGVDRINRLLDAPELRRHIKDPVVDIEPTDLPVRAHFEGVSLCFGDVTPLSDLNLSISLNEITAIVGSVGAGKSVLLDLLVGERAPSSGKIVIEFASGRREDFWQRGVYDFVRSCYAYAPQQPFLSNTTMLENISLDEENNLDLVEEASKFAQLEEDIASFQNNYQEEVGETGINLSGGQKQRVSLARVFISKRPYAILDDPLSAVDRRTEERLFDRLSEQSKGMILVSHRLDELSKCSRILVLDNGKIVEDGSPSCLIDNPGSAFQRFIEASRGQNE